MGLSLLAWTPTLADIYRYMDKNGVWHFTNIKTNSRYKLFLREPGKRPPGYVREYEGIINKASRRFGVDRHLVKAVIRAESDFNHRAVSHRGARGLMQLMPSTAAAMDVQDPFNPEENILGGTRYLGLLLKRFKNDMALALAAYNAGPDKVEFYKGVPPIPETRTFVKKVLYYYGLHNTSAK